MGDTALIFNIIARDKTKGGFDKVKAGAVVAGAAIGAVLMQGVSMAIEKSKLDAKLASQLGASPAQAKALGKLSGKVYAAGFGEDLAGVSTAIKTAAQNGLIDMKDAGSEASQATIKSLLTVGSVVEEDSSRVSAAVAQMLKTGMAGSAEEAMDVIVRATQKGVNKSEDLLDTLNEYGTQFRKLGLDGPAAMGLLSQAIQGGARDSDTAADALKEFSIRAVDGSKTTTAGFEALGLSAQGMAERIAHGGPQASKALGTVLDKLRAIKDPTDRAKVAVQLFGTKAEDLGDALYAMHPETAAAQLGKLKGATAEAAATASNGIAGWTALSRQFQMGLVDTLNLALPAVNAVFGFMQRNSAWVKPLAAGLGLVGVSIGIVTAAQWAWNAALLLSPVTWIIIGIVALIAVIVLVATKTRFFQTVWNNVWGFMKRVGAWFAGPFVAYYVNAWNRITAAFTRARNWVGSVLTNIKNFFVSMNNKWAAVVNSVVNKGVSLANWFGKLPGRISGKLGSVFNGLWSGFRGNVNKIIGAWNRLSFGLPGFSFAGVSVPGISIGTPDMPYMASGGRIQRDGMIFAHRGETITKKASVSRTGPGAGGRDHRPAMLTITGSNTKVIRLLLELLREGIRDQGGNVVKVLTPR